LTNLIGIVERTPMTLLEAPSSTTPALLTAGERVAPAPAGLVGVIEPRWWTGTPWLAPDRYRIDCTDRAMDREVLAPDGELARRMRATFDATGISPRCDGPPSWS
jgi:hypothetical protein